MPRGVEDTGIRQPEVAADIKECMGHPSRGNVVPAPEAGLEGEYVIRHYASHPLPFFDPGQDSLRAPGKRYATAAVLRLALEDFNTVKREVNGGPRKGARLAPAKPCVTKERHKVAHCCTPLMEQRNGLIGEDVFALALAGQQFDFRCSGNDLPFLREVQHAAKGPKVMIDCGHGQRTGDTLLLPAPLHEVFHQRGIDTVKPGLSEGRVFKQGFQMLYVKMPRVFRNSGGQVFQKAVLELGQRRGQAKARYQLIPLPGFNPSGFGFVGLLCAKLVRNALHFDARPPYLPANVQAHGNIVPQYLRLHYSSF